MPPMTGSRTIVDRFCVGAPKTLLLTALPDAEHRRINTLKAQLDHAYRQLQSAA